MKYYAIASYYYQEDTEEKNGNIVQNLLVHRMNTEAQC